jgi:hypothetical protein
MNARSLVFGTLILVSSAACGSDTRTSSPAAPPTTVSAVTGSSDAAPTTPAPTVGSTLADSTSDSTAPIADPATWELAAGQEVAADTTRLILMVAPLRCGSLDAPMLPARIDYQSTEIVVETSFEPLGPDVTTVCTPIPDREVTVDLEEPVRDRRLVDAACLPGGAAETTALCVGGATRWSPQPG